MTKYIVYEIFCLIVILLLLAGTAFLFFTTIRRNKNDVDLLFSKSTCIDISDGKREAFVTPKPNGSIEAEECFVTYMKKSGFEFSERMGAMLFFTKDNETIAYLIDCKDNYILFVKETLRQPDEPRRRNA